MLSQEQKRNWSDVETTIYSEVSINSKSYGQHKLSCPACRDMRTKNKRDKPLSVNIDGSKIIYHCHHCGVEGLINTERKLVAMTKKTNGKGIISPKTVKITNNKTSSKSEEWLLSRGISLETAERAGCPGKK